MELECKWSGTFLNKLGDEKCSGNGKEMEWKIYEESYQQKVEWKQSKNVQDIEWKERESNDISKLIRKWN